MADGRVRTTLAGPMATMLAGGDAPDLPAAPGGEASAMTLGLCVDDAHPTLIGRARVTWRGTDGAERQEWLPRLQHLAVRKGDRVCLGTVLGHPEPVILGVLDGFHPRHPVSPRPTNSIELQPGEALVVAAEDGTPLIEIERGAGGAVVRLRGADVALDIQGRLKLSARDIHLIARNENVTVDAADEVSITGETIKLN